MIFLPLKMRTHLNNFYFSLLASALWPIVALQIPEYQLGTAYGLMQAIQVSYFPIVRAMPTFIYFRTWARR